MTIVQSVFLGIVQGLTEFLPISSSAHLNIMPWLFGWQEIPASFDIALHFGTLLAICIYFFKDWIDLIVGGYKQVIKKEKSTNGNIFWYIVIATIPTGILSIVLDKLTDKIIGDNINIEMGLIAVALIILGIVLYLVDKKSPSEVDYEEINFKQGFLIGLSQAIAAAFPGVSRSGITMTVSRMFKIDRESAAKYSFLLSTPVVLAAVLVNLGDFVFSIPFVLGVLASFISGLFVIKFLMGYLKKGSFKIFAIYRVILGLIIFAAMFIK